MKQGVKGPECNFCNKRLARATAWPIDCYDDDVREQRDRMLRAKGG